MVGHGLNHTADTYSAECLINCETDNMTVVAEIGCLYHFSGATFITTRPGVNTGSPLSPLVFNYPLKLPLACPTYSQLHAVIKARYL